MDGVINDGPPQPTHVPASTPHVLRDDEEYYQVAGDFTPVVEEVDFGDRERCGCASPPSGQFARSRAPRTRAGQALAALALAGWAWWVDQRTTSPKRMRTHPPRCVIPHPAILSALSAPTPASSAQCLQCLPLPRIPASN